MTATTGLSRETAAGNGTMTALRFHAAKDRVEEVAPPGAGSGRGAGQEPLRRHLRHAYSYGPIRLPKARPVAS